MKTIKEKIKLMRIFGIKIEKLATEISLERLHKKKIYQWYGELADSQKRRIVGEGIITGSHYMDQNYYLWSYLRAEDQDRLRKFRKEHPNFPVTGDY